MAPIDFSSSGSDDSAGEDWEQAGKQRKEEQKKAAEAKAAAEAEREAEKRREQLRHRDRQQFDGEVEMTAEAEARAARRLREQQTIKQAVDFMHESSDSSDAGKGGKGDKGADGKGAASGPRRDYTVEDEFMAAPEAAAALAARGGVIDAMEPVTIQDFEKLGDLIAEKVVSTLSRTARNDNDALYMSMLKRIVEGALVPMYPEDAKEIAAVCNSIAAAKLREEAKKKKKGVPQKAGTKSTKPQLNVGGSSSKYGKYDLEDDFI